MPGLTISPGRIQPAVEDVGGARFLGGVHDHDRVFSGQDGEAFFKVGDAVAEGGGGRGVGPVVGLQSLQIGRAAVGLRLAELGGDVRRVG